MINLPLNRLKQLAKSRSIKENKNKKDFSELRHSLRYVFFKSKINEITRSLYNIKIKKNLTLKLKETKRNLIKYESKGVKDKNLLPREYLDIMRPYLRNMINDHKL